MPGGSFVTFDDATSLLYLDNCTVEIGGSSSDYVTWQKGTVYINGIVTLKARTGGSYLQLGDGLSSSNDCKIVILPGSQLFIDNGAKLVNKNLSTSSVTFLDPLTSGFTINTTGTLNNLGALTVAGVLNAASPNNITGNALNFSNGIYTNGLFDTYLTGLYDPNQTTTAYRLRLAGSSQLNAVRQGTIPDSVAVNGVGNVIQGRPSFANGASILLQPGAKLNLALQSELNQNLILNTATIGLASDLSLSDSVKFIGQGTVNFNGYNLILGQKDLTWTDSLLLVGASNLILNANLRLTGRWSFKNDAHIVGNSAVLDLTKSGIVVVKKNTTLTMTDLTINGLGSGSILFEDQTSNLVLQNVKVIMDQYETMTNGNVTVLGASTVVTGSNFLTFGSSSVLTVNGTSLTYDTITYNDQNNILFGSSANESLLNGGSIRKARSLKLGDFTFSADQTLDRSFVVSMLRKLTITNNATINGAGFGYQFARYPSSPIFTVAAGKRVAFTNVLLQDLPIYNNSFGVGSQVIFGDQTTVSLGTNGILNDTWTFSGQVVLNGVGSTLQLGTGQLILRPKTSLLIDNLTISGIQGNNIRCMDNTCTLSFGNVVWVQDATFTLTNSHIEVLGTLDVQGTSTFAYTSNRASIITNLGNLYIDAGMTFSYAPLHSANRDLIVLQTANSLLTLNNATLASTTTGMRLTTGIIDVEGTSWTINDGAVALSEGIAFGNGNPVNDATISFGAGATLNAETGILVYDNQE